VFISLLSIKIRIDIFAAGENDRVDGIDDAPRGCRVGEWWNDDWYEAC
jgi:hypothetical protein